MTCVRRPVVIVEVSRTAPSDPVGDVTGTWLIRGAQPTFEAGDVVWPADRPVHSAVTPAGREFRACSPYVTDWVPDGSFAASLDRALDGHFASATI